MPASYYGTPFLNVIYESKLTANARAVDLRVGGLNVRAPGSARRNAPEVSTPSVELVPESAGRWFNSATAADADF